jgi:hypothetical protein
VTRTKLRQIAAAWIVGLIVLSIQPLRPHATGQGTVWHFVVHVGAFMVATLLPLLLTVKRVQEWFRALSVLSLAFVIETSQGLVYHHPVEWRDFRSDGIGVLIALALLGFGRNPENRLHIVRSSR